MVVILSIFQTNLLLILYNFNIIIEIKTLFITYSYKSFFYL